MPALAKTPLLRSIPGYVDIIGEAKTGATVTVNDEATTRQGGYYQERFHDAFVYDGWNLVAEALMPIWMDSGFC